MAMTDVFATRRSYAEHLRATPATPDELWALGRTLRQVHEATRLRRDGIRPSGDLAFRDHTVGFVLRSSNHPALDDLADHIQRLPDVDLILGDASPRNFSIVDGRVTFCDLENVHRGCRGYDVAYVAAHIVLHHLDDPQAASAGARTFFEAYGSRGGLGDRLPQLIAGVMLYRLSNPLVPYDLRFGTEARRSAVLGLRGALDGMQSSMATTIEAACI